MDLSALVKCLECPVCLEPFKEPRILCCQHQFCQTCLESLVSDQSRLSVGGKSITCPSCRERTVLQAYQQVQDLPKPHLVNQMQEIISQFGAENLAQDEDGEKSCNGNNVENGIVDPPAQQCSWCEDQAEAVSECKTCNVILCQLCEKGHNEIISFSKHKIATVSSASFCPQHRGKLYSHHCQECNVLLCSVCLIRGHDKTHHVLTIAESTLKWKSLLQSLTKSQKLTLMAENCLSTVDSAIEDTKSHFEAGAKTVEKFYKDINTLLQSKCQDMLLDMQQRERFQVEELTNFKTNISELINSEQFMDQCAKQENLMDYATYLIEKVDDRELVQNAKSVIESQLNVSLPAQPNILWPSMKELESSNLKLTLFLENMSIKYKQKDASSPKSNTPSELSPQSEKSEASSSMSVKRRKDGKSLPTLPVSPKSCLPTCTVYPESGPHSPYAMRLKRISTLQTNAEVYHFTFDEFHSTSASSPSEKIFARTRSKDGSLKEYNYQGEVLNILGHGVKGLNSLGCICIDTKRGLFLVTCGKSIACLNESGVQVDEIKSPAGQQCLCGIAYCSDKDLYISSDIMTCSILIINPGSKKVVQSITGNGQWKFRNPSYISCAPGSPTFAVCDVDNHCISIFSTSGRHIKTFGSEGDGNRELRFPSGVCVDQRGRTFVCDRGNKRVVLFWADKSGDHFRIVLPSDEFGHWSPIGLAINHQSGLLAVCVSNVFSSTQEIILYGE